MSWAEIALSVALMAVPWVFWVTRTLMSIKRDESKLLWMHENPENTGFGTGGLRHVIEENSRAIRELSHFVQWSTKVQTKLDPPPFTEIPKG
jgi:hypothetical protein